MTVQVTILGIAGSIRHGNTEIMVKRALEGAASLAGVDTVFMSLADLELKWGCNASYACWYKPRVIAPCRCYSNRGDDCDQLLEAMMVADGILVGAPSYWGGVPAQLKNLFDRSMSIEMGFHLRNKVGGGLTIAAERHGGHEGVVDEIHRWMFIHDMIVVGVGPERPKTSLGGHIGAMAVQGFPFPTHSDEPDNDKAVLQDDIGLNACFSIGKRVAETAKLVKLGLTQLEDNELGWGRGVVASEVFDRAEAIGALGIPVAEMDRPR
jgi:multimeric flavodoxin WrbA